MIYRLEEQANALGRVALGSAWRLYARYCKPRHKMKHIKEEGSEEGSRFLQTAPKRKLLDKKNITVRSGR
jgi:hypothetical protein